MKSRIFSALFVLLFAAACNGTFDVGIEHSSTATATLPSSVETLAPAGASMPTLTQSDPVATLAPTGTLAPLPNPITAGYIDDRSTPSQVIVSFYNAIDRREYARAYGYWMDPSTSLGSFTSFVDGYANTASVDLVFGQITGSPGAGQMYYTVPVILKTTASDGTHANFAACYVVHLAQPANFTAPPFEPMGIDRGQASPSGLNVNDSVALTTACTGLPTGGTQVAASGTDLTIDKSNYLDNRSGPQETVSSFLNALNLKQYVRAYSYFQDSATFPGPYTAWADGYSDTDAIAVTFGTLQTQGAAGSVYFKLPLFLKVITTSNTTQTFVGCYTLRLGQPANQTVPPFHPLGILSGVLNTVDNSADVSALLPTACN